METHRRGSDGRRRFSPKFMRAQMARVLRGAVTVAELSRELSIEPSVFRRWKHLTESGGQAAAAANEDVVPASKLRTALQRIKELERALGRMTMEVEILQAARDGARTQIGFTLDCHDRRRSRMWWRRAIRSPAASSSSRSAPPLRALPGARRPTA
jgi:transposase